LDNSFFTEARLKHRAGSKLISNLDSPAAVAQFSTLDGSRMLTAEQKKQALLAPCTPLRFLIQPETRDASRRQMRGFSDSAVFYRLHSLFWTLREADAVALLSQKSQTVLVAFTRAFDELPWRVIPDHSHIRELPDDDLTPLIAAGAQLFELLQTEPHD
jgi:hypothetical protein